MNNAVNIHAIEAGDVDEHTPLTSSQTNTGWKWNIGGTIPIPLVSMYVFVSIMNRDYNSNYLSTYGMYFVLLLAALFDMIIMFVLVTLFFVASIIFISLFLGLVGIAILCFTLFSPIIIVVSMILDYYYNFNYF